jgi:hypothetical protein
VTDIRIIIEQVRARGFAIYLVDGVLKVKGPAAPDGETARLLDFLREHRDRVKAVLSEKPCWNCGEPMSLVKDIYGCDVLICDHCSVSSDDLLKRESGVVGAQVAQQFTVNGDLKAVELCSRVLEDHLYILFDRAFELPNKSLAVYFPEEFEFLQTKGLEQLQAIHRTKLVFPSRVNQ